MQLALYYARKQCTMEHQAIHWTYIPLCNSYLDVGGGFIATFYFCMQYLWLATSSYVAFGHVSQTASRGHVTRLNP